MKKVTLISPKLECSFQTNNPEKVIELWNKKKRISVNDEEDGGLFFYDLSKFSVMKIEDNLI